MHKVIGFYDFNTKIDEILKGIQIGDKIYCYITKEKVLDAYFEVDKLPFLDDKPIYDDRDVVYALRIGVKLKKRGKQIDFKKHIAPKLDLIKRKDISYAAYFVQTLQKLNEKDAKFLLDLMNQ